MDASDATEDKMLQLRLSATVRQAEACNSCISRLGALSLLFY